VLVLSFFVVVEDGDLFLYLIEGEIRNQDCKLVDLQTNPLESQVSTQPTLTHSRGFEYLQTYVDNNFWVSRSLIFFLVAFAFFLSKQQQ